MFPLKDKPWLIGPTLLMPAAVRILRFAGDNLYVLTDTGNLGIKGDRLENLLREMLYATSVVVKISEPNHGLEIPPLDYRVDSIIPSRYTPTGSLINIPPDNCSTPSGVA